MLVKIQAKRRARTITGLEAPRPDYPLRGSWFVVSVGVHGLIVAALMSATFSTKPTQRPIYDEFIKPNEHKIIFYDFRRKVPEVAPLKKVGRTPDPRGAELSRQAIIASSKKPKSEQVFITVPAPQVEIRHDLPTPIMVARLETMLPAPAAPPKPKPKTFVPPPPSKQEPKLPMQTPVLDAPVPPANSSPVSPLAAPTLTFPKLTAPARVAPEASTAHAGNGQADIAVASLHPSENPDAAVPNGDRPGRFSKAPKLGEAASGDSNAAATLTVPDLTIRQPSVEPAPPPPPIPTHEVLYAERVRSIPLSTLSVPLRPSSRMIPQAVDARFQGRNVYTIVIPMERMATYTGDWIMWFADRESKPGETPVVRAPVPFRKLEPVDQAPSSDRTGARVQFAATLGKNGRLNSITLLTRTTAAVVRVVVDDVTSWEFQPASRDGKPVDVDVVMEIPFNIPTAVARSTQP
jgi:hypothetical protein